jgi:hypothetical protein
MGRKCLRLKDQLEYDPFDYLREAATIVEITTVLQESQRNKITESSLPLYSDLHCSWQLWKKSWDSEATCIRLPLLERW